MVRRHQSKASIEIGLAVELAAIEQHLYEARRIRHGRDHAAAWRIATFCESSVRYSRRTPKSLSFGTGSACSFGLSGSVTKKAGVVRPEWIEQLFLSISSEDFAEAISMTRPSMSVDARIARARPAGRAAAASRSARRNQRDRNRRVDVGFLVGLAHQAIAIEAVGDARGMTQQIENRMGRVIGTSSSVSVPSAASSRRRLSRWRRKECISKADRRA